MASGTRKASKSGRKHLRKRTHGRKGKRSTRRGGSVIRTVLQVARKALLPFLMYKTQKNVQKRASRKSRKSHRSKKQ